jgi:hypothetical protein
MAGLSDLYPPDYSDGDTSQKRSEPSPLPAADIGTIYQPTAAPPEAKPKAPLLSTSFNKVPSAEHGDGEPWGGPGGSTEFPGLTPETTRGLVRSAVGAVTGDTSVLHPEIPALDMPGLGLGVTDPKAWGIIAHMAVSRDPVALGKVIKERLPGATVDWDEKDANGNAAPGAQLTVQVPGGPKMYLDRPGFTPQKGLFYGPQGVAALASGGRSIPIQAGLSGGQHALSNLASYELGGADSPIDLVGTGVAAAAPAVLGLGAWGGIKGVDWLTSKATDTAATIAARAKALANLGFSGKVGDITGDPAQLAAEDLATNAGSAAARSHMQDFHTFNAAQNQAVKRQLVGNISGDVAPGATPGPGYQPNESAFGDTLNDAVRNKVDALTAAEKAAWTKLGPVSTDTAAGRSATFSPDVSADVLSKSADTIRKLYGAPQGQDGNYTAAQLGESGKAAVDAFGQLRRVMLPTLADGSVGAPQGFNLGNLQDFRQLLGNVIKDNPGSTASAAAAQMKRALDDTISKAEMTPGWLSGDAGKLADFRAANAATRARYNFTEPANNPAAERFIAGVTNPDAPYTGQQSINSVFGASSGTVNPSGPTNAVLTHLQANLGDEASKPLAGALTMRTVYGPKGSSEFDAAAPPRFDYTTTSGRIQSQLSTQGRDVSDKLLPPDAQGALSEYQRALDTLSNANRPGTPRLNAPGSGYVQALTSNLPLGLGAAIDKLRSVHLARNATQQGAEILERARAGATTPEGLGISVPKVSTLQDPAKPFLSWQPPAWRAGTPIYRGGGLLLDQETQPPTARSVQ